MSGSQSGFSMIEVLVSILLISILFTIIGAYFVNSYQQSNGISKQYSAIQLAESLLNSYKKMSFPDLAQRVGTSEKIDIQSQLQMDPSFDYGSYSAQVEFQKHPEPQLQNRLIVIKVTVFSEVNGIKKQTSLEGYKRNEEN
ncbi:type IV pilus modification PilV family protein [Neobacillus sp. SM06]|uniref:type IV pilus modification PilV family protein n=1 Tax=Neobacillus sp. SM06 TaxID=3422492 RepID=UPI003D2C353A